MPGLVDLLELASVAALLPCGVAYGHGSLYRPPAPRPLPLNADHARAFLALAGVARGAALLQGRARPQEGSGA